MFGFITQAMRRSRAVVAILFGLLFGGITAYQTLPIEADPDIPIPFIYVGVVLPGIAPEDAERLLVKPMELELRNLTGLKEMRAVAAQNYGAVILEFDVSFDKDQALLDVREKMDRVKSELPDDAEEPDVREFNANLFPVMMVSLSTEGSERALFEHAQILKDQLTALPNVLEANMLGNREEVLEVIIDPRTLLHYNISAEEIFATLSRNNQLVPAGSIDSGVGRFSVSVPGLIENAEDIYNLPIRQEADAVVRLSDVAEIRRGFKDPDTYARFNGTPTISIEVIKRIGANVVDTTSDIRAATEEVTAAWPDNIKINYSFDISSFIFEMIGTLQTSITNAILLVMILVIAALGFRSAMMVGLAIPTSFLLGFLIIDLMGMTVNQMIMFGLVLSVGILVDGAIVVVEYADRKMAEGLDRKEAYAMAADRMLWPIIASTSTTLAAFAPMLLWPGVTGRFMSYLPLTVIIVLSASLLTAMVFLPVVGGLIGRSEQRGDKLLTSLSAENELDIETAPGMTGKYLRLLERCIRHPIISVSSALAILFGVILLYDTFGNGVEFFTPIEPIQANIFIKARGNLSVDEIDAATRRVEDIVLSTPGIFAAFTETGPGVGDGGGNPAFDNDAPRDMVGRLLIEFSHFTTRKPSSQILQDIRNQSAAIPGIQVLVVAREQGPPTGQALQVELSGNNKQDLYAAAKQIRGFLEERPDLFTSIEDSRPLPGIEWDITVDREAAARFNADIATLGSMVQMVTDGILIGHYRPDDSEDEIEIRARYPDADRSFDQLDQLRVSTPAGNVPITNFVTRTADEETGSVNRIDGLRVVDIKAETAIDPETGLPYLAVIGEQAFLSWMSTQTLPDGVRYRLRGANEESEAAASFLGFAMLASLMLMFIILLMQFNSIYYTFLTLSTVVLSTVGVLLGMVVTGQTFSVIMSGTGVVALAGIVVNNSIVLIDTYQRLLESGMDRVTAILKTSGQRLRPILLTTVTTMIGLFPMAIQASVDVMNRTIQFGEPTSAWWVQMATAIIFGLGFSTLLTLILVPVMLALPEQLRNSVPRQQIANLRGQLGRRS